jgi:hypothetical protein
MDASFPQFDLGASIAYAVPVGAAERGSRLSDTTIGIVPLRLDAAYAITSSVGVAVAAAYAPAIPTLCQTASDCISSIGSDVTISLRARVLLPRVGPTSPKLDLGFGYEWLTTKLVDSSASSTRAYNGPLLGLLEVELPFRLGKHWTLAPMLGAMLGVFANESLETGAFRQSGSVPDRSAHGWLTLGVRLGFEPG